MNDAMIVGLYLERSETAIDETAKKYGKLCYRIAYGILSSHEDAEECVNDGYMRVWGSIPPQKPEKLSAYLAKIVRNLSLDRLDKRKSAKNGGSVLIDELTDAIPDTSGSSITDALVLRDALNRFLRSLPSRERRIFLGRYWYAADTQTLARAYKESVSSVKVVLHRTRLALKKALEEEGIVL